MQTPDEEIQILDRMGECYSSPFLQIFRKLGHVIRMKQYTFSAHSLLVIMKRPMYTLINLCSTVESNILQYMSQ